MNKKNILEHGLLKNHELCAITLLQGGRHTAPLFTTDIASTTGSAESYDPSIGSACTVTWTMAELSYSGPYSQLLVR